MLIADFFLGRHLVDAHQRDLSPREPVDKRFRLCFRFMLSQGVGIRGIDWVLFVDGEVWELQWLVCVRQANGVDAGGVADLFDTEFATGTEAVECAVDVVGVDLVVGFAYRVGNRG